MSSCCTSDSPRPVEGFSAAIEGAGMRRKPVSDWTTDELKEVLKRVRMALGEEDYRVMPVVETLSYLTHLAKDKQAAKDPRNLGSSKSKKTRRREKLWAQRMVSAGCVDSFLALAFAIKAALGESPFLTLYVQLCYSESGKGDAAIKSQALGLL